MKELKSRIGFVFVAALVMVVCSISLLPAVKRVHQFMPIDSQGEMSMPRLRQS